MFVGLICEVIIFVFQLHLIREMQIKASKRYP